MTKNYYKPLNWRDLLVDAQEKHDYRVGALKEKVAQLQEELKTTEEDLIQLYVKERALRSPLVVGDIVDIVVLPHDAPPRVGPLEWQKEFPIGTRQVVTTVGLREKVRRWDSYQDLRKGATIHVSPLEGFDGKVVKGTQNIFYWVPDEHVLFFKVGRWTDKIWYVKEPEKEIVILKPKDSGYAKPSVCVGL